MRVCALVLALLLLAPLGAPPAPAADDRAAPRPHVLVILFDDLGWRDVGFHGGEIRTPNLDRLAAAGARLEQFYVLPVCTPTRAALLTGRYPIRTGTQSGVNRPWSRWGLPLEERLLPEALRTAGYRTAITGKWHLGHAAPEYLPTRRGFDRQYGHYCGAIDYFRHDRDGGHDWHRDDRALREEGYSTDLLGAEAVRIVEGHDPARPLFLYVPFNAPHAPLQAPPEYLEQYRDLAEPRRRAFAAMVTCADAAVGRIVSALERRGMLKNTLILFSSDNGGPTNLGATNTPLRAGKGTLYEGGVRVPALAVWPGRIAAGSVVREPLHVVDWYPTLLRLAGVTPDPARPLDGRDAWATIAEGKPSPHAELLVNAEPNRGAVRRGRWKLIVTGRLPMEAAAAPESVELFDLEQDPNETTNLAPREPERVRELLERLNAHARTAVPPRGGPGDPRPRDWRAPAVYGEG